MSFKNTIKLVVSNFSCFWKLLLYYLVAIIVVAALWAPICLPTIEACENAQVFSVLGNFFTKLNVANFESVFVWLLMLAKNIISAFVFLLSTNLGAAIYLCVFAGFIVPFVFGLCELAICENLFGFMSSLTKYSFAGTLLRKIGKTALLQLFKTLIMLPINVAILVSCYFSLTLLELGGAFLSVAPLIFSIVVCLGVSLKITIFGGFAPSLVVMDYKSLFKAFGEGVCVFAKKFFTTLSSCLVIVVFMYMLCLVFGLYILLIVVPLASLCTYTLSMVVYYESRGMRYYVDRQTIITSKKFEELDTYKKMKPII